jgi:hypothetical protein
VVVERLPSAKSLLAKLCFHSTARPESNFPTRQIKTADDVAELVLAAFRDQHGALPSKDTHYRIDCFEPLKPLRRSPTVGTCPTNMTCPVASIFVGRAYFVVWLAVSDIDQSQCFPASSTMAFTSSGRR